MSKVERRTIPAQEIRAVEDDGVRKIVGYAAVFNSRSQPLPFREVIEPGAFRRALQTSEVVALFNHDSNYLLGSTRTGRLKLWEDEIGLRYELAVPETATGSEVYENVRTGEIPGNSFSFTVEENVGTRWETRDGERTRVITDVEELFDVGPVVFPAYRGTVVSARALEMGEPEAADEPESEDQTPQDAVPDPAPVLDVMRQRLDLEEVA